MMETDNQMVGVGKIETKPIRDRKFHHKNGISALVRCFLKTTIRISGVGLKRVLA
jgi:hypothetical protein